MDESDKLKSLPLKSIKIKDFVLNPYIKLVRKEIIPYQWNALNDKLTEAEPSHCIRNFRIAAGEEEGTFEGAVFQDSDVAKWLEAVAYSLATHPDAELEKLADDTIDLIGRAQQKDGYLDTYFIIKEPEGKWKNLKEGHELYTAGHMIEAAVAYTEATGKKEFLHIVCRLADLICSVFGPEENQCHGYAGHEEIELALVRLYETTNNRNYLDLAKYFIDVRGVGENYFLEEEKGSEFRPIWAEIGKYDPQYSQSHLPVRSQKTAEGHAVRAVYLYCAMADIACAFRDKKLFETCRRIFEDMTERRMYLTGSIGSSAINERFTTDYDLPNDRNYSESCASVGLAQFAKRMAMITRDASYMDIAELALYNTVLAGISRSGRRFFYVNPLEVWPGNCLPYTSMEHVKPVRQKWFGVACCPTNIARTLASFGQYLVFQDEEKDILFFNIYAAGEYHVKFGQTEACIKEEGTFPYTGKMKFRIGKTGSSDIRFAFRIPAYTENFQIIRNGKKEKTLSITSGYAFLSAVEDGEVIEISADIPAEFVHANPQVRADEGKIALRKGPLIYCLEETDNEKNLSSVLVEGDAKITETYDDKLFGGMMKLSIPAKAIDGSGWNSRELYRTGKVKLVNRRITAVPYFAWGNRRKGEMLVWMKELFHQS